MMEADRAEYVGPVRMLRGQVAEVWPSSDEPGRLRARWLSGDLIHPETGQRVSDSIFDAPVRHFRILVSLRVRV